MEVQLARPWDKISTAEQNTRNLAKAAKKIKNNQLTADIDALQLERSAQIDMLTSKHHQKPSHILSILNNSSHYKTTRIPTLQNALVHRKALEVNDGKTSGSRVKLTELTELVANDPELQDLTKDQISELMNDLINHHSQKRIGARATNRGATVDFRGVVKNVTREFEDLSERTGSYAIAFVTRGHIDDTATPEWLASGDSMDFLTDSLGLDPWDVTRLFEQWACTRSKTRRERESLASMRAECTKFISSGLEFATKIKNIAMNYANYEKALVECHHVKLVGWTFPQLISPSEIGTVDDIRALRDALKSGACKWVWLTKRELAVHLAATAERREGGEVIGKKRKERSDKGKKRKRKDDTGGENDVGESANGVAGPSKKRTNATSRPRPKPKPVTHKSQLPPKRHVKSKVMISDSESAQSSEVSSGTSSGAE